MLFGQSVRWAKVTTVIKDRNLVRVGRPVRPDSRKRVVLPKAVINEGVTYFVYYNKLGQILLDPQVSIPASELWVFENRDVLASIDTGMRESLKGQTLSRGSFAKHAK